MSVRRISQNWIWLTILNSGYCSRVPDLHWTAFHILTKTLYEVSVGQYYPKDRERCEWEKVTISGSIQLTALQALNIQVINFVFSASKQ